MKRGLEYVLAAMLVVGAAVGCGTGTPSAASSVDASGLPSASPGATAASTVAMPKEFRHPWIRATVPAKGSSETQTVIFGFGEDGITVGVGEDRFSNVIAWDGSRLKVSVQTEHRGCKAGQVGEYSLELSASGRRMVLEPIEDPCATRAVAMTGTWFKSDCPAYPDNFCLGDLDAGRYVTTYFTPLVPIAEWSFDQGAMSYEVPAGWSNPWDVPDEFHLRPQNATGGTGILIWNEIAIVSTSAPCTPRPEPTVGRDPRAITDWIASQPTLVTSEVKPVTIDGLEGFVIEATPASDRPPCMGDGRHYTPIFVHPEGTGMQWGLIAGEHGRFYALDLGGRSLVIEIVALDEPSFRALLPEAEAIVNGLEFRRGD